ncbi:carbamoyltransferase HypF [Streptomyces sp. NPDC051554]|uniref:carbamoyltransferase HypF n=1 Tax=Streptomyces sp. NPDC051554 TaxID=3365656 RepID=UPI0037985ECF
MAEVVERRRVSVRGVVQGVGFRPFVYLQAREHGLAGFVGNNAHGVFIEVEGTAEDIESFIARIHSDSPPLSQIDGISQHLIPTLGETEFVIAPSAQGEIARNALVSPDSAVCEDCLREMLSREDRRFAYPFINCTNCGPRFTITRDVPYDRASTTMARFALCQECAREYGDPGDRRFHAQPNACPACGPRVEFHDFTSSIPAGSAGHPGGAAAFRQAADVLGRGGVIGVKGIGGFHLVCDATDDAAVAKLRRHKNREAKPLAVMVADIASAEELCHVSEEEATLLQSWARPIVLLRRRDQATVSSAVAPDTSTLGVMLAYTPLHHLLLAAYRSASGCDRWSTLVMTSANSSDDPIVYRDEEALGLLEHVADGALLHDRDIHMRCDDSLVRVHQGRRQVLRRARGYAPAPLKLAFSSPVPLLAYGAHNKNTFCMVKRDDAFISHHIGALRSPGTLKSLQETVQHYQQLFGVTPQVVVHDYHPQYQSTRLALQSDVPVKMSVQHHEAHIASVIAEHGIDGPVIGVAADGAGYGPDGTIWGGEFLIGDLTNFSRFAYLEPVSLPGGDSSVKRPWMLGVVHMENAFGTEFAALPIQFVKSLDTASLERLGRVAHDPRLSPRTSSMGRLFDAVSAILGLSSEIHYEGQAAILLEEQAWRFRNGARGGRMSDLVKPFAVEVNASGGPIRLGPLIRDLVNGLVDGRPEEEVAFRFHLSVAELIVAACEAARRQSGIQQVALSGGVFQNTLLLDMVANGLQSRSFSVFTNEQVPPNDGGLSLGQAAIASSRLRGICAVQ